MKDVQVHTIPNQWKDIVITANPPYLNTSFTETPEVSLLIVLT